MFKLVIKAKAGTLLTSYNKSISYDFLIADTKKKNGSNDLSW